MLLLLFPSLLEDGRDLNLGVLIIISANTAYQGKAQKAEIKQRWRLLVVSTLKKRCPLLFCRV